VVSKHHPFLEAMVGGTSGVLELGRFAASFAAAGLVNRQIDYSEVLEDVDYEHDNEARKSVVKWQRKEYRTAQNDLVRRLDEALPKDFDRTVAGKKSAGLRALGRSGRTLHHVLEDTLRHMQQDASRLQGATRKIQSSLSASGAAVLAERTVGNDVSSLHREAMMKSASLIVIEVENPWCWTIKDVGLGARQFFRNAPTQDPWSRIIGQSLSHLIRCEDLPVSILCKRGRQECLS